MCKFFLTFLFCVSVVLVGCQNNSKPVLTMLTHDSFDIKKDILDDFSKKNNLTVKIIKAGDANQVLTRVLLNAGNPEADLIFGIDNIAYKRIESIDELFIPHEIEITDIISRNILNEFNNHSYLVPIDYGFVNINYDQKLYNVNPPISYDDLILNKWNGKFIVLDPSMSSPGLQFLISTILHFGEDGWQDYWKALKKNDVLIVDGWETGYYTHFSHNGGDRPLVVSYTTSPAAEAFFGNLTDPPTKNVIPGKLFRQVESVGILKGSKNTVNAKKFIKFMLSDKFQKQIPETMFVYPVRENLKLPSWWQHAPQITHMSKIEFNNKDLQRWIVEWSKIMRH